MSDSQIFDVIIVGGGIVGTSAAYKLQLKNPSLNILLLEKEERLSAHQTGRNSGVIHSGLYYKPGSYKAKTCVNGRRQLVAFAQKYKISHEICGKVVVATHEGELEQMDKIFERGLANDTEGIVKIGPEEILEREPFCEGIAAIWVPCAGIIDYVGVVNTCAELVKGINPVSQILTGQAVMGVNQEGERAVVKTQKGTFTGRHLIFCGGLQADRLADMDGAKIDARIVGFRGDYYALTPEAEHKVRGLIYPIPNPAMPFLGVHFTKMIDGGIECGPNAVFSFKREGYTKTSFNWKDTLQALSYRGTWGLFGKHWKFGLNEYRRAFSKELFYREVKRMIPSLTKEEITPLRSGVRALALGPDGNLIDDFHIVYHQHSIHVINAPSPAATACLAIGDQICEMAEERFGLKV